MPGVAGAWEHEAGIEDIARIAQEADELGFDYLTCSEHVAVPDDDTSVRGPVYWDPLATLAFLAARTSRIRLATSVVVLGYHHPLAIAKRYGTLDRLSRGRVILGVGVGTLEGEFRLLGAQFDGRGTAADDAIRALRAAWGRRTPEYEGTHYQFRDFVIDPHAPRTDVPIWVGGRTPRSLRRAVTLADGWAPFRLSPEQVSQLLATIQPPDGFDVVLGTPPLDPIGDPAGTRRQVETLVAAGATIINAVLHHRDCEHLVAQLGALRDLYPQAQWRAGASE